ncbi:hypothetical protein SGRA_0492 [Saprospira grandis str. Lewin]|uniref:Uncharacterized protein n=1 Tax=Saprospira grandis (strain Lewin) TaxID=984262 RepID=H6L9Q3_SAPGL|nr:hypothetical protein SGRA_0492 [Saprospira grandis str. Lewin]
MCSSGAQRQTKEPKATQGRANSELRNVAQQGEAAAEAPTPPTAVYFESLRVNFGHKKGPKPKFRA